MPSEKVLASLGLVYTVSLRSYKGPVSCPSPEYAVNPSLPRVTPPLLNSFPHHLNEEGCLLRGNQAWRVRLTFEARQLEL